MNTIHDSYLEFLTNKVINYIFYYKNNNFKIQSFMVVSKVENQR